MPDRYGRVTGADFMTMAKGLSDMNAANEQENDKAEQSQATAILADDPSSERIPGIKASNWAKAQEQVGKSAVALRAAEQAGRDREQARLENDYMELASKGQTPEERLNILGQISPTNLAGAMALGSVQKQVLGTQDGQMALLGSVLKKGQAEYDNVLRPALVSAQDLLAKGKSEDAANALAAASKVLPLRGEWRTESDGQGGFRLRRFHNERNAGLVGGSAASGGGQAPSGPGLGLDAGTDAGDTSQGQGLGLGPVGDPAAPKAPKDYHTATDETMSVDDAVKMLQGMSSKDYALQMAAHRATNMDFNAKALESGGHMAVGKDGEKLRVVPFISPDDSTRQFAVFDARSGDIVPSPSKRQVFTSDEFFNSGFQIISKEQRALDTEERKAAAQERSLGIQEQALGLREGKAKTPVDEGYAEYMKGFNQSAQHDPLKIDGTPEQAGQKRLAEFTKAKYGRSMTLDELRSLPSPGASRGQTKMGLGGGSTQPATAPATSANALLDSMLNKNAR